ncbi:MAG: VWA domain-containing protein [Spirochaeta sp.]|nr:VWA domain-containing protein [Spirochaeta sp.]
MRKAPVSAVVVFVLDCSDSMQTEARITAAQGAVIGLLTPIYQSRYEVAVVVFQDEEAKIVLPASRSVARARNVLKNLWIGGATPLAQGLIEARREARNVRAKAPGVEALLVLLSDGESNVPLQPGGSITRELDDVTNLLQAERIRVLAVDSGASIEGQRTLQRIAEGTGGTYMRLERMRAQGVYKAVMHAIR